MNEIVLHCSRSIVLSGVNGEVRWLPIENLVTFFLDFANLVFQSLVFIGFEASVVLRVFYDLAAVVLALAQRGVPVRRR